MVPCTGINIPKTNAKCGHRHTETDLSAGISDHPIPRGKHEELLLETALSAGRGKQCPTKPSHHAKHKQKGILSAISPI